MSRVQLALNVADIDEAVAFYSKLFATEPAKRRPGYANFAIAEPPLKLVLFENPGAAGTPQPPRRRGRDHRRGARRTSAASPATGCDAVEEAALLLRRAGQGVGRRARRRALGDLHRARRRSRPERAGRAAPPAERLSGRSSSSPPRHHRLGSYVLRLLPDPSVRRRQPPPAPAAARRGLPHHDGVGLLTVAREAHLHARATHRAGDPPRRRRRTRRPPPAANPWAETGERVRGAARCSGGAPRRPSQHRDVVAVDHEHHAPGPRSIASMALGSSARHPLWDRRQRPAGGPTRLGRARSFPGGLRPVPPSGAVAAPESGSSCALPCRPRHRVPRRAGARARPRPRAPAGRPDAAPAPWAWPRACAGSRPARWRRSRRFCSAARARSASRVSRASAASLSAFALASWRVASSVSLRGVPTSSAASSSRAARRPPALLPGAPRSKPSSSPRSASSMALCPRRRVLQSRRVPGRASGRVGRSADSPPAPPAGARTQR